MTETSHTNSLFNVSDKTKNRNAAERRFRIYGILAISIGLLMLLVLASTIILRGTSAFQQTFIILDVDLLESKLDKKGNRNVDDIKKVSTFGYSPILVNAMKKVLEKHEISTSLKKKALGGIISKSAPSQIRDFVLEDVNRIGQTVEFKFLVNGWIDGYIKGRYSRESVANSKFASAEQFDLIDQLLEVGGVEKKFNFDFIFGADASDQRPEAACIVVAMVGSFYLMLVVLVLSLPLGVAASNYLEEFAKQNAFTDIIEVTISNLAAVPSIVFGILGLAVFINYMHLPQSTPIVGGLVLTLMTLPTIIISTRASLKSVPPSIRDAALGLGASKMQTVFHHVLPLAAPGILTGTIIGMAQALGESAPLLLIGMIGYVATNMPTTISEGLLSPNSAMPAQIYEWAKRADPAFIERAWGGIIILLIFLLTMNTMAVILRRRFERRW